MESFFRGWSRRAISIPLYALFAGIVWLGAPAWLLLAVGVDCLRGMPRTLPATRTVLVIAVYLLAEVLGVLAAWALWVFTAGGLLISRLGWLRANAALQRAFTGSLFRALTGIFGMTVRAEGLEHARSGPFLLFVRHASTADTVLAAALVANPFERRLRYVLKRELLWDPCLDIVGQRLPNVFVGREAEARGPQLERLRRLAAELGPDEGVLIYPEGARFTSRKYTAALEALERDGQPKLLAIAKGYRSVLPPRLAGSLALLEATRGHDVLFLEHSGFEGARTFGDFARGALVGATLHVRLRRVASGEVPTANVDRWLFEQWRETDDWVSALSSRSRRDTA
ncbi:MAG: 1-acyl-sn-glycerol-3-phosphate acyltransferase [Myxococcaceae bacterium]